MKEIYVIINETSPSGSGIAIEAYSKQEVASDRVVALRADRPKDRFSYTMLALDKDIEHPFKVIFYPGTFAWKAEPIEEAEEGKRYIESMVPRVGVSDWTWACVYALDRAKAIERAKNYAASAVKYGVK